MGRALLGVLGLAALLQAATVAAICLAPNAGRLGAPPSLPLPQALRQRGATELRAPRPEGGTLASWQVEPRGTPRGTVVLLHGVRMDKRSLTPVAVALTDAGFRALAVDLPGHGESDGRTLTYGAHEARDISALLDTLEARGVELGPVGVYGFSYGGAVAIDLGARDPRVSGVVAVSPFASLRQVVRDYRHKYLPGVLRLVPDAWFQGAIDQAAWWTGFDPDRSAPLSNVARERAPTLLIHGDADTQVPLEHSRELARASAGKAELVVLHGATHAAMPLDASHQIREQAVAWFQQHLQPT